jgi:hypothetical protein
MNNLIVLVCLSNKFQQIKQYKIVIIKNNEKIEYPVNPGLNACCMLIKYVKNAIKEK